MKPVLCDWNNIFEVYTIHFVFDILKYFYLFNLKIL